ncbi:uncharacterized protein METZ01_LOCUS392678 [marine metagenome]|uniref:Uncharacterized protein n=1 Tax=marine metagenome TaxID=408172 RepID=A0A382V002_9ZZZZ
MAQFYVPTVKEEYIHLQIEKNLPNFMLNFPFIDGLW